MNAKKLTAGDLNLHRTELNSEADKCPNKHRVVPYTALVSRESKPICTEYCPSRPTGLRSQAQGKKRDQYDWQ